MKLRDFLEQWGLSKLKIKLAFLEGEFRPNDPDRYAAWELYVELLTRITTQYLAPEDGDEQTALDSVHALFPLTREILRKYGSGADEFAKLAIPVLNQVIRPFTAKWHRLSLAKAFEDPDHCREFRVRAVHPAAHAAQLHEGLGRDGAGRGPDGIRRDGCLNARRA